MEKNKYNNNAYATAAFAPNLPVIIDEDLCTGCNKCVDICRMDVLLPNPEKGKPPIIMYPEECWFAGCCVGACPEEGAIWMEYPINLRMNWKRKETGEIYRIGINNPPPPDDKRPVG